MYTITRVLWAQRGERGILREVRIFLPSFRASREMPHLPCMAHKSPVMQAIHTVEKLGKCICLFSIQQLVTKIKVFFLE